MQQEGENPMQGGASKLATMMNDKLHDFLSHFIKCFSGLPPWVKKMRWGGVVRGWEISFYPIGQELQIRRSLPTFPVTQV